MISKKFASEVYSQLPAYKAYQTKDSKELILVDRKYEVVKQGKHCFRKSMSYKTCIFNLP